MALDKQLTGKNFCGLDCVDRQNIIHPETCVDNTMISNTSTTSLNDWLSHNPDDESSPLSSFTSVSDLLTWLRTHYQTSYTLPAATTTSLGGVKIDNTYLTINNGVLGLDRDSLNIPSGGGTETPDASFSTSGKMKLGNSTQISEPFSDSTITNETFNPYPTLLTNNVYKFPLRIDSHNRAGIVIPTEFFTGIQNSVLLYTEQTLSDSEQLQARTNIGAGTSNFSGNYEDLTNRPSINNYSLALPSYSGGPKSKIVLTDGTNDSEVTVRMAASNIIPEGIVPTDITNDAPISEILFYSGDNISLKKVDITSVNRQGLQINAEGNPSTYVTMTHSGTTGGVNDITVSGAVLDSLVSTINKSCKITNPKVFVNYVSASGTSTDPRTDSATNSTASTNKFGMYNLLEAVRNTILESSITYYIMVCKDFDLNLTIDSSSTVYKQYVTTSGSVKSYCGIDYDSSNHILTIGKGLCAKLDVFYNNGNQTIFIDSYWDTANENI